MSLCLNIFIVIIQFSWTEILIFWYKNSFLTFFFHKIFNFLVPKWSYIAKDVLNFKPNPNLTFNCLVNIFQFCAHRIRRSSFAWLESLQWICAWTGRCVISFGRQLSMHTVSWSTLFCLVFSANCRWNCILIWSWTKTVSQIMQTQSKRICWQPILSNVMISEANSWR